MSGQQGTLLIYLLSLSGGAGRNAVIYANALADAGLKVALVCGTTKDEGLEQALDTRVSLRLLGARRNLLALPGLIRALRAIRPARALVIGPSNMAPFTLAAIVAGFTGKVMLRVSNSPIGMQAIYSPPKRMLKRWSFRRALRRAHRVIALTRDMVDELAQVWSVPRAHIHHIPNGVTLPDTPSVRSPDDPPMLLCVARLAPQKDHETLLRAFAILRRKHDCRLVLAGGGGERARLEELAHNLGIADDVTFLGHVADVAPLYRRARLVVLSSRHEGFPNVLIEALAHGCPLVATDCPTGPAEVIDSPEIGLLARVGDAEDLADKLATALDRDFDPSRLRERAEHFSLHRAQARICDLFESLDESR